MKRYNTDNLRTVEFNVEDGTQEGLVKLFDSMFPSKQSGVPIELLLALSEEEMNVLKIKTMTLHAITEYHDNIVKSDKETSIVDDLRVPPNPWDITMGDGINDALDEWEWNDDDDAK